MFEELQCTYNRHLLKKKKKKEEEDIKNKVYQFLPEAI